MAEETQQKPQEVEQVLFQEKFLSVRLTISIIIPLFENGFCLFIVHPQRGFSFSIQVIAFHDQLAVFKIAADFRNAVAVPINAFFAEGIVGVAHIKDVGDTVSVEIIAFGLRVSRVRPGQARALFGATKTQTRQQKYNPGVFGFAHKAFVAYP